MMAKGRASRTPSYGMILAMLPHRRLARSVKKQDMRSVFHA
jgi:hypothetical protein